MVLLAPALVFTGFIAILTLLALYEVGAMTKAGGIALAGLVLIGGAAGGPPLLGIIVYPWIFAALVIVAMLVLTLRVGVKGAVGVKPGPWLAMLGAAWAGALFPYFALLRNAPRGIPVIMLMLLLVIVSDSGAYFVGRAIGRHKLLERVSPNKTIEGAIGGLLAVLAAVMILRPWLAPDWTTLAAGGIALGIGVMAQAGDLVNSAYKRVAGVKDSGWFFPGHGGLMDRACSLVFAAVLTYYWSHWRGT
jgi:phosphatidate cytidylyltransferase